MELKDYLRLLRRRWWLLVLCALLGTAGASIATARATPVYGSSTTFFLADSQGRPVNALVAESAQTRFASYNQLVGSAPVVGQVLERAQGPLLGVTSAGIPDTVFFTLSVQSSSPQSALELAQAYGSVLPSYISQFEGTGGGNNTLRIFEAPTLQSDQLSPDPQRNLLIGLGLGLVLGVVAILLLKALDNRVRTTEELEHEARLPLLAQVPLEHRGESLVLLGRPRAQRSEAVRQVRANVQFAALESPISVLLVTSAVTGEGKTSLASDLAVACAQAGQSVVLVDADLRRPRLDEIFGLAAGHPGLTGVLTGQATLDDALHLHADTSLQVLSTGALPARPSELLASQAMSDLLAALKDRAELVILDSAPVVPVADAVALLPHVDAVLLVSRLGVTTKRQVRSAADRLRSFQARVVGVVANGGDKQGSEYYQARKGKRRRGQHAGQGMDTGLPVPVRPASTGTGDQQAGAVADDVAAEGGARS